MCKFNSSSVAAIKIAVNKSEKEMEKEKCRYKATEKEEAKERARFVSLAMLRLWRAECRRCIGNGVGVQMAVTAQIENKDGLLGNDEGCVPRCGSNMLPVSASAAATAPAAAAAAASLNCASDFSHSSSGSSSDKNRNRNSGSSSSSGNPSSSRTRGGYEVLGKSLVEWELFVLEGPETQKRYCNDL